MAWSLWLVPPFLTSIFFLGVITLYWSIYTWISGKLESSKRPVNLERAQSIIGITCAVISIFSVQLLVRTTSLSWAFTSFQILILIFISYFIQVWLPYWLVFITGVVFMVMNGTIIHPLSWVYTFLFAAFYLILYYQAARMGSHPYPRYLATVALFGGGLWLLVRLRFSLSWATTSREFVDYLILASLMYGYFKIQSKDRSIKNRLFKAANWDALTHVQNYAAYDREIGYQFHRQKQLQRPLAMLMFDIDHFKHVNDTYGHLAGDRVLEQTAGTVKTILDNYGNGATLFRTGGEEFNIIIPGISLTEAEQVAQVILDSVGRDTVVYDGTEIKITVSLGVSSLTPKDHSPLDFYKRVDNNLYHSKKNGRNQITADRHPGTPAKPKAAPEAH